MLVKLEVDEQRRIVTGSIEGELTSQIAKSYFEEVAQLSRIHRCVGILTDLRAAVLKAGEEDMECLSNELAQLGLRSDVKRAVVVNSDVKAYKVWENYNLRAGFIRLKLFVDKERAEGWLVEQ